MEYSRDDELEYSSTVNIKLFAEESGQKVTDQTAHMSQEQSDMTLLCFNLFFLFICLSFNIQRAKARIFLLLDLRDFFSDLGSGGTKTNK